MTRAGRTSYPRGALRPRAWRRGRRARRRNFTRWSVHQMVRTRKESTRRIGAHARMLNSFGFMNQPSSHPGHTATLAFTELPLDPRLLQGVAAAGYTVCTPIQAQVIPAALEGHDITGMAQTGT